MSEIAAFYNGTMQTTVSLSSSVSCNHIEVTPGVCGGKPRISGTRIRVQDIVVWHERLNLSADEIASQYPQVSVAAVYAALMYYHDHRQEIDDQMARGDALVAELKRSFPSKLAAKLNTPSP